MAYTFGKALDSTTNAGSIYDRSSFKGLSPNYYPHIFSLSVDYTVPAIGPVRQSRIAKAILADWRLTSLSTNQSGQLLGDADLEQLDRQLCVHGLHQDGPGSGRAAVPERPQLRLHRSDPGNRSESRGLAEPGSRAFRAAMSPTTTTSARSAGRPFRAVSARSSGFARACGSASARSSSICSTCRNRWRIRARGVRRTR